MARGRMILTTVATDMELNALSEACELFFLKTIPHLDRDGLITGHPSLLWAQVAPLRPALQPQVEDFIQQWIAAKFVIRYECKGEPVIFFKNFRKANPIQYSREAASRFDPPGWR